MAINREAEKIKMNRQDTSLDQQPSGRMSALAENTVDFVYYTNDSIDSYYDDFDYYEDDQQGKRRKRSVEEEGVDDEQDIIEMEDNVQFCNFSSHQVSNAQFYF